MLIAIRYTKNDLLALTMALVQPQIAERDDIYIIDTTENREGLEIAKKYGTSKSVILTEVGDYSQRTSIDFFEEYAKNNGHKGILYLKNVLISTTFVSSLKRAITLNKYKFLSPEALPNRERLNPNFKWHCPPTRWVKECNDYIPRCLYVSFTGKKTGRFTNEKIVLL